LVRRTRGPLLGSSKRQTSTAAWTLEAPGRGLFAGTAAAGAPTEESSPEEEEARWRLRRANRLDGEEEKEEAMAMCVEVKRRVRRGLMAVTVITARRWRYRGGVGGVAAVRRPKDCDLPTAIWVKVTVQSKRSTVAPFKKTKRIFQRKCQKETKLYLHPGVALNAHNHVIFLSI
jgi:hypothetical protein